MKRRAVAGLVCAFVIAAAAFRLAPPADAQGFSFAVADHGECSHLTMLRLPDVKISEAVAIPAATTSAGRVAHCRVAGVIGTEIRFSLLLPDRWNKKFFMGGGGGFVGSIQNSALSTVNDGYATVGTDTGHQAAGTDASWALNNLERKVNFGYLAIHRTAEAAKAIVASYYTTPSTRNYFMGCSRGGGQALMEAQRFPDDFDGIVAGAPAYDWAGLAGQMVRDVQVLFPDPKTLVPLFTKEELALVETKILEACDAQDGVKDGTLNDPRQCRFDVGTLPLSDAKKAALEAVYSATTNRDGEIYPAQPFGGEGQGSGWPLWITGGNQPPGAGAPSLRFAFGMGIMRYLVFNDPNWDYSKYDLANWRKDTAEAASYLNATNPDLSTFKARGGKLVLWHGWADPALTPLASIRYHDQVLARDPSAHDYFRTFLLPGVLHCGGGSGPDTADWAATIAEWVENGKAPERVVARKMTNGVATRTRPLCSHPHKAEYKGAGSTDDEANFVCR
jgi:feruloyl esterase